MVDQDKKLDFGQGRFYKLSEERDRSLGSLQFSQADIDLTKKLKEGGRLLDAQLLDHIIITSEAYYSFTDEGLL